MKLNLAVFLVVILVSVCLCAPFDDSDPTVNHGYGDDEFHPAQDRQLFILTKLKLLALKKLFFG